LAASALGYGPARRIDVGRLPVLHAAAGAGVRDLSGSHRAADRVKRFRRPAYEGSVMQARMATYSFSGDADALARRAEEGILPILQSQPGFKAYSVAVGDGEVLSMSVWDSRADAEAGSEVVASWVAENMASDITLIGVRFAEIKFSTTLGVSTSAGAAA
jgi:heme-degrading monooxygenase HmoA